MGPRIENVGFSLVLPLLFEGSRWPGLFQENEQLAGPGRLGGGGQHVKIVTVSDTSIPSDGPIHRK